MRFIERFPMLGRTIASRRTLVPAWAAAQDEQDIVEVAPRFPPMPPALGPPLPKSMGIYWPWVTPPPRGGGPNG